MGNLIINEDCTHFLWTRKLAGIKPGKKELLEFIDQYANTDVEAIFFNPTASLAWYDSKIVESAVDRYKKIKDGSIKATGNYEYIEIAYDLMNQGLDLYQIWFERSWEVGIEPWVSIRMNDIHNSDDPDHYLHSAFTKSAKHMQITPHREPCYYWDRALDYSFEEVREYYFKIIEELVMRYPIAGIELDFMREVYSFNYLGLEKGIEIINEFVKRVRDLVKGKDEKIKVSIRVPSTPEKALRFGFDVFYLIQNQLIDLITPTPRWRSIDNDIPVDVWKKILHGTGIVLAPGMEVLIEGMYKNPRKPMYNTIETAAGTASAMLALGADKVYTFNYMDTPEEIKDDATDNSVVGYKSYPTFLKNFGSIEKLSKLKRRHVVTYSDIVAPGTRNNYPLPIKQEAPAPGNAVYYIPTRIQNGKINPEHQVRLLIGASAKIPDTLLTAENFSVFVNTKPAKFIGLTQLDQVSPDCPVYEFELVNDYEFPLISIIETAAIKDGFTIEWLELQVY